MSNAVGLGGLSRLREMGDAQFLPGYCLLLPDPVVPDLNALTLADRQRFLLDMTVLGDALLEMTDAFRINYEILGNSDPALHAHLFPRYAWEPNNYRKGPAFSYPREERNSRPLDLARDKPLMEKLAEAIRKRLGVKPLLQNKSRIVRFVYLSPADKAFVPEYKTNLERGARNLQAWFFETLNGYTFQLNEPNVVEWVQTKRPAAWYRQDPTGGRSLNWYWQTVLAEAFALTGAGYNQPHVRWMFYMDAFPGCQQAIGATSGVALVGANDLRGLSGETFIPPCPGEPVWDFTWGRWVGGMAHELGHTVGIDHPIDSPGGPDDRTLMYQGYIDYPNTYLRESDKQAFLQSGFFYPMSVTSNDVCETSSVKR